MSKSLEQRIIDGFLADDADQLAAVAADVGGDAALRHRAKAMGLTYDFIKRCRLSGSRPALRPCMRCDTKFLSWGVQNRLCRRCSP